MEALIRSRVAECLEVFTRLWHERKGRDDSFNLITLLQRDPNTAHLVERPMEFLGNLILLIVGGSEQAAATKCEDYVIVLTVCSFNLTGKVIINK